MVTCHRQFARCFSFAFHDLLANLGHNGCNDMRSHELSKDGNKGLLLKHLLIIFYATNKHPIKATGRFDGRKNQENTNQPQAGEFTERLEKPQ